VTPGVRAEIQTLLERLADGDRAAAKPAFDALWPVLRAFSARALGSDADAEDAAQQALLKLFAQVSDLDPKRDAVAWALTIAAYECRTVRRSKTRKREVDDAPLASVPANAATAEEALIEHDLVRAARELLLDLREEDAQVILAAIGDARPTHDATFRKRLSRAIGRLRLIWRAKHEVQ
jgi:RNA polymerase sigma factor (sigma-70 family)